MIGLSMYSESLVLLETSCFFARSPSIRLPCRQISLASRLSRSELSKYILTRHKDIIARGKTRLIDDISLKISAVKARAGKVFISRVWNRFHTIYESTEYVHLNIKNYKQAKFIGNNY